MIGIIELCGADEGFKGLARLLFELSATPFFGPIKKLQKSKIYTSSDYAQYDVILYVLRPEKLNAIGCFSIKPMYIMHISHIYYTVLECDKIAVFPFVCFC